MQKDNDLALFFGMLCGDGWLTLVNRKNGYKNYKTGFCNTDEEIIKIFDSLFYKMFSVHGHIGSRQRLERKRIFEFQSYSREVFEKISSLGFPIGVKRDVLRAPEFIKKGSRKEKLMFIFGLYLTDGSLKKNSLIYFHSGSKFLLEDVANIIKDLFGGKKEVKSYLQRSKFYSYQLGLNKKETGVILSSAHIA